MGANLSSTFEPDLSKVVLSPPDAFADILMVALWGGAIYAMAMIWTTCQLVDRWKGPNDRIRIGASSAFVAMVLSTMWPVVMLYLLMSH